MATLGIITCQVLTPEFAYLLAREAQLAGITVLENTPSSGLIDTLEKSVPFLKRIPHIRSFRPDPLLDLEVVVQVLDLTLHRNKAGLQKAIQNAARGMAGYIDGLLLGYGMCGGTLHNIEEILSPDVPIFLLTEGKRLVDDCVGMMIGGKEKSYARQRKITGTFFMTAGWAVYWKRLFAGAGRQRGVKRIFEKYERILVIVTPVMSEQQMLIHGEEMARCFNLRCEVAPGSLTPLNNTWNLAKKTLFEGEKECFRPLKR